ncbi:hypothetical protein [Anaerobacillus sp. 1_MG-2023]|uniref:hypothetical protein n=1 Tax=Anaerobacillus sp. 1_MG-2023 TaxID=3062655 RepID=UPI0026E2EC45|nr:hypothetical protein [Anaerobacillus sp. 1_MG-2023]MDO6654631.1 hypothetical protein [Anaerobacillus sp. 1_MG-2023]
MMFRTLTRLGKANFAAGVFFIIAGVILLAIKVNEGSVKEDQSMIVASISLGLALFFLSLLSRKKQQE